MSLTPAAASGGRVALSATFGLRDAGGEGMRAVISVIF